MPLRRQPEALARLRINNMLTELGWRFEQTNGLPANVRLEGDFPDPEIARRMKGLRPDYHLYQDNSNTPIAFIEAKKPNHPNLAAGLEQARRYARALDSPDMLIFCSDGAVTMARHIGMEEPLRIGGEIVQSFLTQQSVIELVGGASLAQEGQAVASVKKMVSLFAGAGNKLRADGVETGMDSLREFCLLLFSKIIMERENRGGWRGFSRQRGDMLLNSYRRMLNDLRARYPDVIEQPLIRNAQTLEGLIDGIRDLNFHSTEMDIKGGAYEYFLSRYSIARNSALGQYFTPRHITRMISQLLDPRLGETVFDPFCGTGGMLVGCYGLLKNQVRTTAEKKKLDSGALFGVDIGGQAAQLARMNMILLGDGHSNIKVDDSLRRTPQKRYDYVVTNIPFNMPAINNPAEYKNFPGETNNNTLAVLHCLHAVKKGGAAAIILPETIAYDARFAKLRRYLRDHSAIRAIIRLPRQLFIQYTTAQTFLLLLQDVWTGKTDEFPCVDLLHDGFSKNTLREPVPENQIPELLEATDLAALPYAKTICARGDEVKFFEINGDQHPDSGWRLGDLIEQRERQRIDPGKYYAHPALSSADNTVRVRGDLRLGLNISNRQAGKIIAEPGDLIIATLHTQRDKGLFAFADREYIITTQIAGRVKEDIIGKEYLKLALRKILPTLRTTDLVGRETYSAATILSLRIPPPPPAAARIEKKIERLKRDIETLEGQLQEMIDKGE